ncbi:BRCT domain-containing protein [Saccharophagus degradans]|uniref:BRCT domain-containing protein n=1 Tax=Saccharophagus degradans TaxID=86304 RepID=A0AAW7X8C7_9GAMM|nr:BRCT domain-containing protein [Saccharophagus degradans]MBU2987047.1 BRCT domain-containing protein [Saccharophagus degradans]MDO6423744.1 BRCT domain-containing protein [Saccharophagus degradans]MDO6607824.1 BRCT domain-containing protein [Saccharophagus degradans]
MDIFTRFNRNKIADRQLDTLIGLSKGIAADGNVNQAEAEFLQSWLVQNGQSEHPVILNLLTKVSEALADGVLDEEESRELLTILRTISGESSEIGEVAKTSSLPLCSPAPKLDFAGKSYLFTGTCAYGNRKQCQAAIEALGGVVASSVTKKLDVLVLGTYVTESWAHETFGRKIEKAMAYRESGLPIAIVSEQHWVNEAGF